MMLPMPGRAALVALALLAGAPAAHADPTSEAMVRDFVAWVDSSPDWSASVSLVRSDGADTIVEGLVFSRDDPRVSISVEELRLRDLAKRDDGGFAASDVTMTAGSVVGDKFDARVPSATAEGLAMPNLAGAPLDPSHMMRSMARFYTIAAEGALAELKVPEASLVQRETAADGSEVEVRTSYRDLLLEDFAEGVLRHQQVGSMSISAQGSAAETFEMGVDEVTVDRVDIGGFAHVFDETQYRDGRGDGIWRPVMSRASYSGVQVSGPEGVTFSLDEAAIENIDMRQTEKPFTSVWDQILNPDVPDDAKSDLALEALAGMAGAFRMGTARIDGVSVEAPKENATFTLDSITLSGWSSAGVDSFIMKALLLDSPEAYFSLGSMELAGFVSPDIRALMRFMALEKGVDAVKHAEAIRETFAALPRLEHFGMEALVAGQNREETMSLDRLSLDFHDWNEIFAEATDFRLENLRIPRGLLNLDPQASEVFDGLGYSDVAIDMALSDRWTPDIGTDQSTWSLNVADAGDIELSYTLTGLTLDWLTRATAEAAKGADGEEAVKAMLSDLGLARATLSVTDRSLLDRVFGVVAKRQGVAIDGPAYREQMRAALPFIISAVIPVELAKRLAPPLQSFMAGGQTLFADVTPPTPLGLLELAAAAEDPLKLPDLLHLELRSDAAKN